MENKMQVRDLRVSFRTTNGKVQAVRVVRGRTERLMGKIRPHTGGAVRVMKKAQEYAAASRTQIQYLSAGGSCVGCSKSGQ